MVLDITIGAPSGFDEALATNNDDNITFDFLPTSERTLLQNSPFPDAIALFSGNDTIIDNDEDRLYFGNMGNDELIGNGGSDSLVAGRDEDTLEGGNGNDFLFGNVDNDTVNGGLGNDLLRGGQNEDILDGGDGNDTLYGDFGVDTLIGGSGSDQFVLSDKPGKDIINDFQDGIDQLSLPEGFSLSDLRIFSKGSDTGISLNGREIATLNNIIASGISAEDFVEVSTTPSISSDPGNTPNQAAELGILSDSGFTINESVRSAGDPDDYYLFSVPGTSNAQISVDAGGGNPVNVSIFADLNEDGSFDNTERLELSSSLFVAPQIEETLGTGNYLIRVFPDTGNNSPYELSVVTPPLPSTLLTDPGNAENQAFNLGDLNGLISVRDFVGVAGDSQDYYRFTIPTTASFANVTVNNISDDIEYTLSGDPDGDGIFSDIVSTSTLGVPINQFLNPGTYLIELNPLNGNTGNSEYNMSVSV